MCIYSAFNNASTIISIQVCSLPKDVTYLHELRCSGRYVALSLGHFAVADCSASGQLKPSYCIIQGLKFSHNEECCVLLTCTCQESSSRLKATSKEVVEDLKSLKKREESLYCIHHSTLSYLHCTDFPVMDMLINESDDSIYEPVAILNMQPLLAAVISKLSAQ